MLWQRKAHSAGQLWELDLDLVPQVYRVNGSGRTRRAMLLYLGRSRGSRVLVCLEVSGRPFGAGLCVLIIFHRAPWQQTSIENSLGTGVAQLQKNKSRRLDYFFPHQFFSCQDWGSSPQKSSSLLSTLVLSTELGTSDNAGERNSWRCYWLILTVPSQL